MDSNDFEQTFERNNKRLFLIALSFTANQYDAEDILQKTFLKLLQTKTEFESDEHIDKWLTFVTVNESKNLLKNAFRRKSTGFEEFFASYSFDCEKSEDLFNAVMSLPKKLRTVIHLFYYDFYIFLSFLFLFNLGLPRPLYYFTGSTSSRVFAA